VTCPYPQARVLSGAEDGSHGQKWGWAGRGAGPGKEGEVSHGSTRADPVFI
jgi:hypothetical protein